MHNLKARIDTLDASNPLVIAVTRRSQRFQPHQEARRIRADLFRQRDEARNFKQSLRPR